MGVFQKQRVLNYGRSYWCHTENFIYFALENYKSSNLSIWMKRLEIYRISRESFHRQYIWNYIILLIRSMILYVFLLFMLDFLRVHNNLVYIISSIIYTESTIWCILHLIPRTRRLLCDTGISASAMLYYLEIGILYYA